MRAPAPARLCAGAELNELSGTGLTVTCLCPGATDTGFQGRAGVADTKLFKTIRPMDAKTVTRDGYRGLMAGKRFRKLAAGRVVAIQSAQAGHGGFAQGAGQGVGSSYQIG